MADVLGRLAAALADRYRLDRELGRGGMATVYLAHDLKHERQVAIKVLHEDLGATLGPERFLAEIKTTAKLQHPHILTLLDSGEAAGLLYYVMPYVEGESLRDRLTRETQLPIEDAVRIAREVADALGHAHGHGIIHRDIKPENILLQGGHALVADFGIALAVQHAGGARLTQTGLSLGTPQYMAPEQAMGEKTVDHHADIYALGAVTYEMLTGEPPFTGATVQAIVAKVLSSEPELLTRTRKTIPVHVEAAVLKALAKLPADRWATAGNFSDAITNALSAGPDQVSRLGSAPTRSRREWVSLTVGAVGVVALVASGWLLYRSREATGASALRYTESLPLFEGYRQEARIAISADGRQLALVMVDGRGVSHVELRRRDELRSTVVAGTEGAISVFFSPDGTQLGFLVDNPLSLKIVRPGGPVAMVAAMRGGIAGGTGGVWGKDGWIYLSGPGFRTVKRFRPDGTAQEDITTLDTLRGEWWQGQPFPLSSGTGVLFTVRMRNFEYRIAVAELRTKTHRFLVPGARAIVSPGGHLLVAAEDGTLRAAHFDEKKLEITGSLIPVASDLRVRGLATVYLAMSESGTLVYELRDSAATTERELVWVTPAGAVQPLRPPAYGRFSSPSISPDGERVAIGDRGDVWILQLGGGVVSRSRLTDAGGGNPRWMPDGRSVSFASAAEGSMISLFARPSDGSVPARLVLKDNELILDARWSPMNGWVAYREFRPTLEDIFATRPGIDSSRITVAATPANECSPVFSPDGRSIAYMSTESSQPEVYVRPFPNVPDGRLKVSASGGVQPIWDQGGNILYYLDLEGVMWAGEVKGGPAAAVLSRRRLFETASWRGRPGSCEHEYDLSPRDHRFLMLKPMSLRSEVRVVFVEGFAGELERRLSQ